MRSTKKQFLTWKKVLFFVYILIVGFVLYFNRYGYKTYLSLKNKQKNLEKIKAQLIYKKETLKRELELQNASSPFFIEMIARERLRMAKDGEYIYFISKKNKRKK